MYLGQTDIKTFPYSPAQNANSLFRSNLKSWDFYFALFGLTKAFASVKWFEKCGSDAFSFVPERLGSCALVTSAVAKQPQAIFSRVTRFQQK